MKALISRGCLFFHLSILGAVLAGCAHQLPPVQTGPAFSWERDRFAFANETVWSYEGSTPERAPEKGENAYSRRCFVMSRAALQFWKFARFEPGAKKVSAEELKRRVRQVTGRPVWKPVLQARDRTVFPGYASLAEFSRREPLVLQENIGAGWPTYFRPGNFSMSFEVTTEHQLRTANELREMAARRQPAVVWIYNFPSLSINHAVLVHAARTRGTVTAFDVYDPNYTDGPKRLTYDSRSRVFSYQPTFYFKGGSVKVRTTYWSPLQ